MVEASKFPSFTLVPLDSILLNETKPELEASPDRRLSKKRGRNIPSQIKMVDKPIMIQPRQAVVVSNPTIHVRPAPQP